MRAIALCVRRTIIGYLCLRLQMRRNVLPEFEKVLDIDIKAAAEAALGKTLDQNLLSVVF